MKTKIKNETPPDVDPTPANRMVKSGGVKVRAVRPVSEEIGGVIYRFTTGDEFETTEDRAKALGPLVTRVVTLLLCVGIIFAASAAPVKPVTRSGTGTTAVTVTFPGGTAPAVLTTLDVTSDKAGSVASWRYGTTPFRLVVPTAASGTNFYLFSSSLTTNDVFLAQNSADAVTNYVVWGTNSLTNVILHLNQPIGTNLVAADTINKLGTVAYALTNAAAADATNYPIATTNGLAADDVLIIEHYGVLYTGTVFGVNSNSFDLVTTIGTNLESGEKFYKLTNSHPVILPATRTADTIIAANATNLTVGDTLILSPATGGHFKRIYTGNETFSFAKVMATAAGIAMAADDHVWYRGGTNTTPVGAATVRLYGSVFLAPPGRPAMLVLDGTSACSINNATVEYQH